MQRVTCEENNPSPSPICKAGSLPWTATSATNSPTAPISWQNTENQPGHLGSTWLSQVKCAKEDQAGLLSTENTLGLTRAAQAEHFVEEEHNSRVLAKSGWHVSNYINESLSYKI